MSTRAEAVLFDYGHTLARYELGDWDSRLRQGLGRIHAELARMGALPPLDEFTEVGVEEIKGRAKDTAVYPLEDRLRDLMRRLGLQSSIPMLDLAGILMSPVLEIGVPDPDAHVVLTTLKDRGLRLGLVSNCPWCSPSSLWREEMHSFGFDAYLDCIQFCTEVGVRKPDPRAFRMCLDQLGTAPERAVYVGDYQPWDVVGAKEAGLVAVWRNVRNEELDPDLAAPDYTIHRLLELLDLPPLRPS